MAVREPVDTDCSRSVSKCESWNGNPWWSQGPKWALGVCTETVITWLKDSVRLRRCRETVVTLAAWQRGMTPHLTGRFRVYASVNATRCAGRGGALATLR